MDGMRQVLRIREDDAQRVSVVVGVAGAGKTSYAMSLIEQAVRDGVDPRRIGFLSFSRAAVQEAARRAAEIVGCSVSDLTQGGYYRTIHSAAVRLLGIDTKSILDVSAPASQEWFQEHVGLPYGGERGTLGADVANVLNAWDRARQSLSPVLRLEPDGNGQAVRPDGRTPLPEVSGSSVRSETSKNTGFFEGSGRNGHLFLRSVRTLSQAKTLGPDAVFASKSSSYIDRKKISITSHAEPKVVSEVSGEYNSIYGKDLWRTPWCPEGVRSVRWFEQIGLDGQNGWVSEVVERYERGKNLSGRLDFTDILLRFCQLAYSAESYQIDGGWTVDRPEHIELWLCDEYQDCSALLDLTAQHLWGPWAPVVLLGDPLQSVYRFAGSDPGLMQAWETESRLEGSYTLLRRSWRNPQAVIEWGEACLEKLPGYQSREPLAEGDTGTVGLLDWWDLIRRLEDLAEVDTLILARNNWNLEKITKALYERGIPWQAVSEERSSRWEAPAKIGLVATIRALLDGEQISEQDFRRLTESFPAKADGVELFTRGTKARWKKLECSQRLQKTIGQLTDWGAGEGLADWLRGGAWRTDMLLQIDTAAERWGMGLVRKPKIRVGTCHSVKGMEARVVLCLAASTAAAAAGELQEEVSLQYVTVTRASSHYRLVVDQTDVARGLPLFWAAPEGCAEWDRTMEWIDAERERLAVADQDPFGEPRGGGPKDPGEPVFFDGDSGPDRVLAGEIFGSGSEATRREADETSAAPADADPGEWWDL